MTSLLFYIRLVPVERRRLSRKYHALNFFILLMVGSYTLRSLIIGTCAVIKSWNLQEDDVNANMMPLFHVGGIVRNLFAPMMSGGSAIVAGGFDATAFWTLATEFGATWYGTSVAVAE
jgi:acyl-CoA synthetase (AMP-forming)/AMP-acid ligase II